MSTTWSLASTGPSSSRVPRCSCHQSGAGGMVPSLPAWQGIRWTSIPAGPCRQALASTWDARVSPHIETSVTRPPWSPRHQADGGSKRPASHCRLVRLDPPVEQSSRDLERLAPSVDEARAAPRSQASSYPWRHHRLDAKVMPPPRYQDRHAASIPRRPDGHGTSGPSRPGRLPGWAPRTLGTSMSRRDWYPGPRLAQGARALDIHGAWATLAPRDQGARWNRGDDPPRSRHRQVAWDRGAFGTMPADPS
jgi:hypothetical protein